MVTDLHPGGRPAPRRWHPAIWAVAAGLLLLPAVAMRFQASGVDWSGSDFVVMGALLGTACGAYEAAARLSGNTLYRAAAAVAVLGGLALVWANLAVGLVGDGANPANLMFMGVPVVAVCGAVLARFRATGMACAMLAAAAWLALVGVLAAAIGWGGAVDGPLHTLGVTAFFLPPWLLAAALFRIAARREA